MFRSGAFWFGVVVGFITYRTIQHKTASGISDIAAIIGAIGGGAVLTLFPTGTSSFDDYAFGLAIGLGAYLAISVILAWRLTGVTGSPTKGANAARVFLGDDWNRTPT